MNQSNLDKNLDSFKRKLSILSVELSNETTYMSYIRTGLAIATIALPFRMYRLVLLGLFMIILGTVEYYYIRYKINQGTFNNVSAFKFMPIFLTIIILFAFYYESKKLGSFKFIGLKNKI